MTTQSVHVRQNAARGGLHVPPARRAAGKLSPGPPAPSGPRWSPYSPKTPSRSRIFSLPVVRCQPSSDSTQGPTSPGGEHALGSVCQAGYGGLKTKKKSRLLVFNLRERDHHPLTKHDINLHISVYWLKGSL